MPAEMFQTNQESGERMQTEVEEPKILMSSKKQSGPVITTKGLDSSGNLQLGMVMKSQSASLKIRE